jgi:hypothetical protein
MEYKQIFRCGDRKYYVSEQSGYFIVRRQDWIERTFVGYAQDIAEAIALIEQDARSNEIRAA